MNVQELMEILSEYSSDTLIVIDHIEGYISPNAVNIIQVSVVDPEQNWDGHKGDYQMDEEGETKALHIGLLD